MTEVTRSADAANLFPDSYSSACEPSATSASSHASEPDTSAETETTIAPVVQRPRPGVATSERSTVTGQ